MNTNDTPQQKLALRRNSAARAVRAKFPAGTRVMGAPGRFGTVLRHVPALTALGGVLVIEWDNGETGRSNCLGLTVADEATR